GRGQAERHGQHQGNCALQHLRFRERPAHRLSEGGRDPLPPPVSPRRTSGACRRVNRNSAGESTGDLGLGFLAATRLLSTRPRISPGPPQLRWGGWKEPARFERPFEESTYSKGSLAALGGIVMNRHRDIAVVVSILLIASVSVLPAGDVAVSAV